jgi:hypothetical protein
MQNSSVSTLVRDEIGRSEISTAGYYSMVFETANGPCFQGLKSPLPNLNRIFQGLQKQRPVAWPE